MFDAKRSVPGEKWVFLDKSNDYPRIALIIDGEDLICMRSKKGAKPIVGKLRGFESKTALQAIRKHGVDSGDSWGAHFEDAIYRVWEDCWLDSGWYESGVKSRVAVLEGIEGDFERCGGGA